MSGPARLVVTAEITVTGEQVQGTVHGAGCPVQAFSGWSELFAVLLALISAARGEGTAPGRHPPVPTQQPDAATHSPADAAGRRVLHPRPPI